nr:hypothetical protein BaRGS_028281 [Batillaria attramentaria]
MLFIGVVGNSSVILGVLADRSLRTPTFVVIGSLALADMLFVGLRIPIEMFFMITSSNWPYGALSCKFLTYGRMVPAYAASYHLVLLALVRYYLLSRPLKSIHTLTVRRTAFASLALWVFFLAALSPLLVFTEVQSASGVHTCTIVLTTQTEVEIFFASYSIFSYVIPLIFLGVFHVTKVRHVISAAKTQGYESRHRNQMTLTAVVVILLFGILLLPVHSMNLLITFGHVARMPDHRLPNRLLYGELQHGKRSHGGQKKRFKDTLQVSLKAFEISPDS